MLRSGNRYSSEMAVSEKARRRPLAAIGVLAVLLLCAGVLSGCHLRPLLSSVSVTPDTISPNADGTDDATNISYKLTRNAAVSIYLENAQGQQLYFRKERPRSAGEYQVQWGGVINQPYWLQMEDSLGRELVQNWLLPDGTYTWVVEATEENGHSQQYKGQITLSGGDSTVPELQKYTVTLPVFTPNQDGLADRTGISYSLNKSVDAVQVYLYSQADPSVRYPIEEQQRAIQPGEVGYHYYDYDGGVDRGADPPPDGDYVVAAEAWDKAGHHVTVSSTLTIQDGGLPRADIVQGTIQWGGAVRSQQSTEMYLPLGATLVFTTYIENYGQVPIRTSGPPSGTCYRSDQNFNTLAVDRGQESWHEQAGVWRFGINFDTGIMDFPYRWAVGRPNELRCETIDGREQCFLDPGKRGTITGCIELVGPFPRKDIFAWGGLIHEWVGVSAENNYVDRVLLHVGEP